VNDQTEAADTPAKKGKGKMIMLAVLLLAGGAGGGWFFMGRSDAGEAASATAEAPAATVHYHAMAPAFVVNLADEDMPRYLQVEVTVTAPSAAVVAALEQHDPVIRNRLVLLFGQRTMADLNRRSDKERLQEEALAEVQAVLTERIGEPGIDGLFFTSLVAQ
jgi:flagellar FliL protein